MPSGDRTVEIELDFVAHALSVRASDGLPLGGAEQTARSLGMGGGALGFWDESAIGQVIDFSKLTAVKRGRRVRGPGARRGPGGT